jgi:predicted O-methyltransferase YrrM
MIPIKIQDYADAHSTPEDDILRRLNRETHLKTVYPQMLSGPILGKFLEMMSRMVSPMRILEIGTFTGYSAICLAKGLKQGGRLHTIENNPELSEISSRYIEESGFSDVIIQHIGDAREIIPTLPYSFEMVFLDASKEFYPDFYKLAIEKVVHGGYIIADNVLWDGKVLQPVETLDKESTGIWQFNELVINDHRVEVVMLPIRDGVSVIRKK